MMREYPTTAPIMTPPEIFCLLEIDTEGMLVCCSFFLYLHIYTSSLAYLPGRRGKCDNKCGRNPTRGLERHEKSKRVIRR